MSGWYDDVTEQVEREELRWDEAARRYVSVTPAPQTGETAPTWGDPAYCQMCRREEAHTYYDHCRAVAVTRIERMED